MSYVSREQIQALQIAMDEYATSGERAARQEEYYRYRLAGRLAKREERIRQAARVVLAAIVILALVVFAFVWSDWREAHSAVATPQESPLLQNTPQTSASGATGRRDGLNLRAVAREVALDHGIPPRLFSALIQTESSWRENARGAAGERCLTQLMPAVAAALGVNPDDPLQCLQGGARLLRKHYRRTGDWSRALAAYNGRGPRAEAYAQKVLRAWEAGE